MIKHVLLFSTLLLWGLTTFAQTDSMPKIQMHAGWRSFQTDLNTFNASLPAGTSAISSSLQAVELSMDAVFTKFMINSDLSIGTRNRSYPSAYEQIIFTQTRWSFSAGPVMHLGKKKKVQLATLGGVAYGSLDLRYRNDTVNKTSSIPWIINQQPSPLDEDPRHYSNPAFLVLVQQRASVLINDFIMLTAFAGYQQDLGKGRWHYEYGFVRRNSPESFSTGLSYGLTLGLHFPLIPTPY